MTRHSQLSLATKAACDLIHVDLVALFPDSHHDHNDGNLADVIHPVNDAVSPERKTKQSLQFILQGLSQLSRVACRGQRINLFGDFSADGPAADSAQGREGAFGPLHDGEVMCQGRFPL